MAKAEVIVCDMCKQSISIAKCVFCDKDLCERCEKYYSFGWFSYPCCKICDNKIGQIPLDNKMDNVKLKGEIAEYLRSLMMLTKIEDGSEKKKDNPHIFQVPKNYFGGVKLI